MSSMTDGDHGQAPPADRFAQARHDMVELQIRRRHITEQRVLDCLARVPRHEFVPAEFVDRAYDDIPLPIGGGQTISQPYIVAAMSAALHLSGNERVLEVGTGLGYQAAILGCLAREVFGIEVRSDLAKQAAERLARLGYTNVYVHHGDGTLGLPEFAPFDAILVAAAAPAAPAPLLEQLGEGGRMVIPVGDVENQELQLIDRIHDTYRTAKLEGCRFVPLLGAYGWRDSSHR